MIGDDTLLQLLLGTAFVALAGLAWHSRSANLDDHDEPVPSCADMQAHSDKLEAERRRRSGEDRRLNDPALPYVGEGYDRRQIVTRRLERAVPSQLQPRVGRRSTTRASKARTRNCSRRRWSR